jgi:hypothetical protein
MSSGSDNTLYIREVSWEDIQEAGGAKGWYYPQNYVSQWMPLYKPIHRNIITLFILLAIILFVTGLIMPFVTGDWSYLWAILGSFISWGINRNFLKRFFLINLSENEAFYNQVRNSDMADIVKVQL